MNSFKNYFVIAYNVRAEYFNDSDWCYTEYDISKPYNIITTYRCRIKSPQTITSYNDAYDEFCEDLNYMNDIDEFDVTNIMEFLRGDKTFDGV